MAVMDDEEDKSREIHDEGRQYQYQIPKMETHSPIPKYLPGNGGGRIMFKYPEIFFITDQKGDLDFKGKLKVDNTVIVVLHHVKSGILEG